MSKRILLVDDEEETRNVFDTALRTAGYQVQTTSNGKETLDVLATSKFDLILLDQMMPDMSGNETLRAIKANPAMADNKVAMLTNFGHDDMVKEALNLGASDYILKYQVSGEDLVKKVKQILGE